MQQLSGRAAETHLMYISKLLARWSEKDPFSYDKTSCGWKVLVNIFGVEVSIEYEEVERTDFIQKVKGHPSKKSSRQETTLVTLALGYLTKTGLLSNAMEKGLAGQIVEMVNEIQRVRLAAAEKRVEQASVNQIDEVWRKALGPFVLEEKK